MRNKVYSLLYVDDELPTKPHLAFVFERFGFDVTAATTGQQALDLLMGGQRFDAVLVDYMMPPGSDDERDWPRNETHDGYRTGYVLLTKLQRTADEGTPVPPVWVLTAFPDTNIERRTREMGIVKGYVYKSGGPGKLAEVANEILAHLCSVK